MIKKILILACIMSFTIMMADCAKEDKGLQSKAAADSTMTGDTDTLADGSGTAQEDEAGVGPAEISEQAESTQSDHDTALTAIEESENKKI